MQAVLSSGAKPNRRKNQRQGEGNDAVEAGGAAGEGPRLQAIRGEQVECTKLALPARVGVPQGRSRRLPCKVNVASVNIARLTGEQWRKVAARRPLLTFGQKDA